MKKPIIKFTTNLDQFKYPQVNRDIKWKHVDRLEDAMRRKNLLGYFPIIVDADKNVIDGQHRLEAARRMRCGVFYFETDEVVPADIVEINSLQLSWNLDNYCKFYAESGNDNYVRLLASRKRAGLDKVRQIFYAWDFWAGPDSGMKNVYDGTFKWAAEIDEVVPVAVSLARGSCMFGGTTMPAIKAAAEFTRDNLVQAKKLCHMSKDRAASVAIRDYLESIARDADGKVDYFVRFDSRRLVKPYDGQDVTARCEWWMHQYEHYKKHGDVDRGCKIRKRTVSKKAIRNK